MLKIVGVNLFCNMKIGSLINQRTITLYFTNNLSSIANFNFNEINIQKIERLFCSASVYRTFYILIAEISLITQGYHYIFVLY